MPTPIELRKLFYFVEIAKAGSVRAASEHLGLSRSVVSEALSALEEHTGATLMQRTSRGLILTEIGERSLKYAKDSLISADTALNIARQESGELSGLIRVTAPSELCSDWLPKALSKFQNRHPAVNFELHASDTMVDLVNSRYDLAIRARLNERRKSLRNFCKMFELILVASPSLKAKIDKTDDLITALHKIGYIANNHENLSEGLLRFAYKDTPEDEATNITDLKPSVFCDDKRTALDLAIKGFGAVYLTKHFAQDELDRGSVVQIFDGLFLGFIECRVEARDRTLSPAVSEFRRFILSYNTNDEGS